MKEKKQLPIYGIGPYFGAGVILTGGLLVCNLWLLILPPLWWLAMTLLVTHTEEKWLTEYYGKEYLDYCRRVNRCIPWLPKNK